MTARDPLSITGTPRYEFKPQCVCGMAEDLHLVRDRGGRGSCGGTVRAPSGAVVRCPCLTYHPQRPTTPDRTDEDGFRTVRMKRACNGCGNTVGDVTAAEMEAGMDGEPLPDARPDCPTCWAAEHLPTARPLTQPAARAQRTQARVRGAGRRG